MVLRDAGYRPWTGIISSAARMQHCQYLTHRIERNCTQQDVHSTRSWLLVSYLIITHGYSDTLHDPAPPASPKAIRAAQLRPGPLSYFQDNPQRQGLSRMRLSDRLGLLPQTG